MKRSTFAAAALCCAMSATAGYALAADAEQVKVFDATQLTFDRYTVLKRIWTDTWRTMFWISTYDEQADAVKALLSKAADAGADAVINLECLNDRGGWSRGYFCYALAIKLK